MDRETAIRLGLRLMNEKFDMDASAVIPEFVHILYDSDNGTISDEEIYDPDMDATEECRGEDRGFINEALRLRSTLFHALNQTESFLDEAGMDYEPRDTPRPTDGMVKEESEPEPRIRRLKRKLPAELSERLEITGEWLEENEDGTFDRFASVICRDGLEIVTRLALITYDEGRQVKVGYGEVFR